MNPNSTLRVAADFMDWQKERAPDGAAPRQPLAFGQKARDGGIAVSMRSRGDCYDNAVAESFFAALKKELVHRRSWPTRHELIGGGFEFVEARRSSSQCWIRLSVASRL